MKLDWIDSTAYPVGALTKIPREYTVSMCDFSFTLHRLIHAPNTWFFTCSRLSINHRDLLTDDLNVAEQRALSMAGDALQKYVLLAEEVNKLLEA